MPDNTNQKSLLPLPRLVLYFTTIPLMLLLGLGSLGHFQMRRSAEELGYLHDTLRPVVTQMNQVEHYLLLAQSLIQENLLSPPIPSYIPTDHMHMLELQSEIIINQLTELGLEVALQTKPLQRARYFTTRISEAIIHDPNSEDVNSYFHRISRNLNAFEHSLHQIQSVISQQRAHHQIMSQVERMHGQILETKVLTLQMIERPPLYGSEVIQYLNNSRKVLKRLIPLAESFGIDSQLRKMDSTTRSLMQNSLLFYKEYEQGDQQADTTQLTKSQLLPALNSLLHQLDKVNIPFHEHLSTQEDDIMSDVSQRSLILLAAIMVIIALSIVSSLTLLSFIRQRGKLMLEATEAISSGELDHRIHMPSRDFMQKIALSFNQMAKNLQHNDRKIRAYTHELDQSHKQLELRVKERTTELENSQQQLTKMAFYDSLTGLPNRALFCERLEQQLKINNRLKQKTGVMFLDLDKFKLINDNYGHNIGDQLLQAVAQRISACLKRKSDTVARLGGDEFTVLLPKVEGAADCIRLAEEILDQFKIPLYFDEITINSSPSIGIAISPDDGSDVHELLKNADTAMYQAKMNGKNQYSLFDPAMADANKEELALRDALLNANYDQEFEVYYQPKVDAVSGAIDSFEALVRWHHPSLGFVSPVRFIPLAEETGVILGLGEWVLRQACRQTRAWQKQFGIEVGIAVNLSPEQFKDPHLESRIFSSLSETQLEPRYLELEITENPAILDMESTFITLNKLRSIGLTIALDDFGTGYASLSHFKELPIDTVKVDRSFIRKMTNDPWDQAIISAIALLSKKLNIKLVAEGVEEQAHVDRLTALEFDLFQGYYFSKPLPEPEATTLLAKQHGRIQNKESVTFSYPELATSPFN